MGKLKAETEEEGLQRFGEFFGERTIRGSAIGQLFSAATLSAARRTLVDVLRRTLRRGRRRGLSNGGSTGTGVSTTLTTRTSGTARGPCLGFRPGRLSGIRAQKPLLQGSAVKAPDDRIHFIGVWRLDKREALGLLRFRVADHFNRVRDQVFGC